MDASKRMVSAKAMKAARAAKAGASSAPAAGPNLSLTLPLPRPTTTEAPLGSSSPPPHSPQPLQTPGSPPPIAAVPLVVASSPAPTPLGKGKRVLEILSDDEDSDGVVFFKRRKPARVPVVPTASPREGIPSGTTLQVLPLFLPQWSKRKQAKGPNLLRLHHWQRSLLLLPPSLPPQTLLLSLLQLCI